MRAREVEWITAIFRELRRRAGRQGIARARRDREALERSFARHHLQQAPATSLSFGRPQARPGCLFARARLLQGLARYSRGLGLLRLLLLVLQVPASTASSWSSVQRTRLDRPATLESQSHLPLCAQVLAGLTVCLAQPKAAFPPPHCVAPSLVSSPSNLTATTS